MAKKNFTLTDDFELRGIWWLPDNPDLHVSGILTFENEKEIRLELIGSFKQESDYGKVEIEKREIILGVTNDSRLCTLVNCYESSATLAFPGISCQVFKANYLLEGFHWNSYDEIKFEKILIGFDCLEIWLGHYPIKTNVDQDEDNKKTGFTVNCNFPRKNTFYVNKINSNLSTSFESGTKDVSRKSITLAFNSLLELQPDQSKNLQWYDRQILVLQQLLTLLIGHVTYLNKLVGAKCQDKEFINIFWVQKNKQPQKSLSHHDMIITLPEMSQEFCSILEKWYSNYDELESTYDLFFGALFNSSMYINFHFLSLMQAIETFHRQIIGGKYIKQDEYNDKSQQIKSNIPKDFPSDLRDAIKSRIKYGNEFALRKRIKGLFESMEQSTRSLSTKDYKMFIEKIVQTRNYFTHYDEELKPMTLTGDELFFSCQRLKIFIISLLLKNLGLNEKIIQHVIQRNKKIQPWDK